MIYDLRFTIYDFNVEGTVDYVTVPSTLKS